MTAPNISFAEAMLACVIAQRHWDNGGAIGDVWRDGAHEAEQFYRGESMRSHAPVQVMRALDGGPAQDDAVADAKDGRIEAMREAAQAVLDAALDAHDPTGGWQYGRKMGKLGSAVRAYREVKEDTSHG